MNPFHQIALDDILLQQPPFRFVDSLEACTEDEGTVSFTPGPGNLLMENGCLCAAGLIEHMAQANAAREGYVSKYIRHIDMGIGYIGQVRNFSYKRLPREGERLTTTVKLRYEMFNVCLCDVEVRSGEELLASANLKTALKDDEG
ncbi:MAG: pseudouridylate synthase [Bacteroidales bacterium]|nr:pseudouridylate synthase [Bacteroidales bacterium]